MYSIFNHIVWRFSQVAVKRVGRTCRGRISFTLLLLLLLLNPRFASARHLTPAEAAVRVAACLPHPANGVPLSPSSLTLIHSVRPQKGGKTADALTPAVYVFQRPTGGFVVAAADDVAYPLLGYADTGVFSADAMPLPMQAWLQDYAEEIAAVGHETADVQPKAACLTYQALSQPTPQAVSPLLGDICWGQGMPYNYFCPKDSQGVFASACPAGCAAIAAAQIMRYHAYPICGKGSHAYTTRSKGYELSADFSSHCYEWMLMLPNYSRTAFGQLEAEAVATLVSDIGIAADMDYTPQGSGTYDSSIATALIDYFDYDAALSLLYREHFSTADWQALLRAELAAGRPVMYSGTGSGGGHAFVCDGCDATEFFHFNWGWDGASNGYFRLSALKPADIGTGGSSAGYNAGQSVLVGIRPNVGGVEAPPCISYYGRGLWCEPFEADSVAICCRVGNKAPRDFKGNIYLCTEQDGAVISREPILSDEDVALRSGFAAEMSWSLAKADLREGQRFYITSCPAGTDAHSRLLAPQGISDVLVVQKASEGDGFELVPDVSCAAIITVDSLCAATPIYYCPSGTRSKSGYMQATLTNDGEAEQLIDLRTLITLGDSVVGQSVSAVHVVPAHTTATFPVVFNFPATPGEYTFTLCHAYTAKDWEPLRFAQTGAPATLTVNVTTAAEDGDMAIVLDDIDLADSTAWCLGDLFRFTAHVVNRGAYGACNLRATIATEGAPFFSTTFYDETFYLDSDEKATWEADIPLVDVPEGKYILSLQAYSRQNARVTSRLATVPFTINYVPEGIAPADMTPATASNRPIYNIWGVKAQAQDRIIIGRDGQKRMR